MSVDMIDDLIAAQMDALAVPLADGVEGFIRDDGRRYEVGMVRALVPGSGKVGAFLDSLPTDRRVTVPWVTSEVLQGMLARRGFRKVQRFDERMNCWGDVWTRKARTA